MERAIIEDDKRPFGKFLISTLVEGAVLYFEPLTKLISFFREKREKSHIEKSRSWAFAKEVIHFKANDFALLKSAPYETKIKDFVSLVLKSPKYQILVESDDVTRAVSDILWNSLKDEKHAFKITLSQFELNSRPGIFIQCDEAKFEATTKDEDLVKSFASIGATLLLLKELSHPKKSRVTSNLMITLPYKSKSSR